MIRFGLPNESIELDPVFGEVLVSVDDLTSVVTFIWSSKAVNFNSSSLYTLVSTCYDGKVLNNLRRSQWISTILGDMFLKFGTTEDAEIIRVNEVEPFVVQALAFDNIEKLKGKTHDRKSQPAPAA